MLSPLPTAALVILTTVLAFLLWRLFVRRSKAPSTRELEKLRDDWGNSIQRDRDFDVLPAFLTACDDSDDDDRVDDQTWHDLNLTSVFAGLDRT